MNKILDEITQELVCFETFRITTRSYKSSHGILKPKVKKVLATEELKYPVFPYQIKEVTWDDYSVVLNSPLSADVSFDEEASVFKINYPELNILVWGKNSSEVEKRSKWLSFLSFVIFITKMKVL